MEHQVQIHTNTVRDQHEFLQLFLRKVIDLPYLVSDKH